MSRVIALKDRSKADDGRRRRLPRAASGPRRDPGEVVLDDVSIAYAGRSRGQRSTLAVSSLSATVKESERFVILGPSGCGKSTLLRAVAGFLEVTGGQILVDNTPVTRPTRDHVMVFQDSNQLLPWRTVEGNVEFALERCVPELTREERRAEVRRMLELVHLQGQAGQYPHTLSGGQKQRCAIARSFASRPSLLLMDEPFGALDAITRESLQAELNNLWERLKTTIVFITHDVTEAVRIGDRVLVMTRGPGRVRDIVELHGSGSEAEMCDRLRALLVSEEDRDEN